VARGGVAHRRQARARGQQALIDALDIRQRLREG
jgi:hypothetical protein